MPGSIKPLPEFLFAMLDAATDATAGKATLAKPDKAGKIAAFAAAINGIKNGKIPPCFVNCVLLQVI